MNLKEFLLLPSFIAVIRFSPLCGGGGGGKNLGMVVVVFVIAARYYRNVVRWWRKSTWNGGGGGCVGGFGEEIKKNEEKWNYWIVFRVSKSYNQYKICWHIPTKHGLSHLSLLLATSTRGGRGIPSTRSWAKHISLVRYSVFFALLGMHELPAKNQWNGNETILGIVCNR